MLGPQADGEQPEAGDIFAAVNGSIPLVTAFWDTFLGKLDGQPTRARLELTIQAPSLTPYTTSSAGRVFCMRTRTFSPEIRWKRDWCLPSDEQDPRKSERRRAC